jgi:hypothetical protein
MYDYRTFLSSPFINTSRLQQNLYHTLRKSAEGGHVNRGKKYKGSGDYEVSGT